jgi:tripartite-type tricarboxylate transporter receptor subunit TctC
MRSAYTQLLVFAGRRAAALMLLFVLAIVSSAHAGDYPDRPVKIIVPFAAGGTADAVPRCFRRRRRRW